MSVESDSLADLNREIKQRVKALNAIVQLEVKIENTKGRLRALEVEKDMYKDYLKKMSRGYIHIKKEYAELFENEERLHESLNAAYKLMSSKCPNIDVSQWQIPSPIPLALPKRPRPGVLHTGFAKLLVSGCMYGYRSATKRYCYIPKLSVGSATVKLEELKFILAQVGPSVPQLELQLEAVQQQEASAQNSLEMLKEKLAVNQQQPAEYVLYCETARLYIQRIQQEERRAFKEVSTASVSKMHAQDNADTLERLECPKIEHVPEQEVNHESVFTPVPQMDVFTPCASSFNTWLEGDSCAMSFSRTVIGNNCNGATDTVIYHKTPGTELDSVYAKNTVFS